MTISIDRINTNLKMSIPYETFLFFLEKTEEGGVEQKFQYFEGEIIPMHSEKPVPEWFVRYVLSNDFGTQPIKLLFEMATINHGQIISNLHILLGMVSKTKNIKIYSQGTFVYVEITGNSFLPDLFFTNAANQQKKDKQTLLNPLSVFEVLSNSTKKIDKVNKLDEYQQIESVLEYILIDQYKPHVTIHRRISENMWKQEFLTSMSSAIHLESIDYSISLAEIYDGVEFE